MVRDGPCSIEDTPFEGSGGAADRTRDPEEPSDPDAVIRALARRQHGVVCRSQLLRSGVPHHVIRHRLKGDRLQLLHRGVYRVGPLPMPLERETAAVLACGDQAVLSHRSAAVLWGLLPEAESAAPVHVSIDRGCRAPGPSVRVHRVGEIASDERTDREGIPVTAPARTILDLAGSVFSRELEQSLAAAERSGLVARESLAHLLERHPRRPGSRALRDLLSRTADPALTRSQAEDRLLALIRKARLREPRSNVRVQGLEVDFLWRAERLVVEIDGYRFHSSRAAFERDRRRDQILAAAGFQVVRVTWKDLTEHPEATLVHLAQALARRSSG